MITSIGEDERQTTLKIARQFTTKCRRQFRDFVIALRAPRLSWASKDRGTKVIKYITKKNGQLETKEERKKRLAKKEAALLRMFQAAYNDHHNQ